MKELIQIILINLVVSCDNVGVIALATRNLPHDKATTARRIGIGLSLVMKILFIAVVGFLFAVPWLHIRIVGGILLIYVTFNMLRQHTQESSKLNKNDKGEDSFLLVIISIIAADVSMSLDNVVAILGVVSSDGHSLGFQEITIVFLGLLACVPILLWFSETVSHLMERFQILSYLCAGYLIYTAVKMIFEDEMIKLFFEHIHFTFALPAAILCGILMVIYGVFTASGFSSKKEEKRHILLPIYCIIVIYSLVTVGTISYLSTNPFIEGQALNVESIYGFTPYGANAVYTIGASSSLFTLCAIMLAGIVSRERGRMSYKSMLLLNVKSMVIFVLLELTVCTVGLSFTFGLGSINLARYLLVLLIQILLLLTYTATFCMFSVYIRSKAVLITIGMLYVFIESMGAAILAHSGKWAFWAMFFPSYHIASVSSQIPSAGSLPFIFVISILYIAITTFLGHSRYQIQK